jgi:hypothetical protein
MSAPNCNFPVVFSATSYRNCYRFLTFPFVATLIFVINSGNCLNYFPSCLQYSIFTRNRFTVYGNRPLRASTHPHVTLICTQHRQDSFHNCLFNRIFSQRMVTPIVAPSILSGMLIMCLLIISFHSLTRRLWRSRKRLSENA